MMENQVTSIEQSKRLLELGIPERNASMLWERYAGRPQVEERFKSKWHLALQKDAFHSECYEYIPAFTVVDLLEMVDDGDHHSVYVTKWGEEFSAEISGYDAVFFKNRDLIDSTFQLVERLQQEGRYITL